MVKRLKQPIKNILVTLISKYVQLKYRLLLRGRVEFGPNFRCSRKLIIKGPGKVIFGANVNAWTHAECNIIITYNPGVTIKIGSNVRLNGAGLQAKEGITIGDNCIIGSALLVDTDFHSVEIDRATNPFAKVQSKPITVGNNVWLAGQTVVLKGTTIGDNSVVGFRAVVTQNVPENVVVAGNPARIVRHLNKNPSEPEVRDTILNFR